MRNRVCGEMLISFQQLLCSKINKGVYSGGKKRKSFYLLFSQFFPRHCGLSKKRKKRERKKGERIRINVAIIHLVASCDLPID